MSQPPARLILLCHSVGGAKMKALQTSQCHRREDQRFAAIEQHSLHQGLVEFFRNTRGGHSYFSTPAQHGLKWLGLFANEYGLPGCHHHLGQAVTQDT